MSQGQLKQSDFGSFAQDIHARLYLTNDPPELDGGPDWATKLHQTASELSEWQQLKSRCKQSGLASGIATEEMLQVLLSRVPQGATDTDDTDLPYTPFAGDGPGNGKPTAWTDKQSKGDSELRRQLRKAIKQAREKVVAAEQSLDGLDTTLQLKLPGNQVGEQATFADIEHIRKAHDRIKHSHNLQRIAELAGRLFRKANTDKKTKVKGSIGKIKGVELSGEIHRILPSEFVGLKRSKLERLLTLNKIVSKRAFSYKMEAEKSETKGPIVVLQDLSNSMRGDRDTFAKAVSLAILTTATQQKRDWTMIGFNAVIRHEDHIPAGTADIDTIYKLLRNRPSGGTEFDPPLQRANDIIRDSDTMRKADIILITDGEADVSQSVQDQIKELTNQCVQLYVIGIGHDAATIRDTSLGKIATKVAYLATTNNTDPVLWESITLD